MRRKQLVRAAAAQMIWLQSYRRHQVSNFACLQPDDIQASAQQKPRSSKKKSKPIQTENKECPHLPPRFSSTNLSLMLLSSYLWGFIRCFCHFSRAVILWEPRRGIILFSVPLIVSDPEKRDSQKRQTLPFPLKLKSLYLWPKRIFLTELQRIKASA